MARLAFDTSYKDGNPPTGDKHLYIVGWIKKDDPRPEADQTPTAYSVHKKWMTARQFVTATSELLLDYTVKKLSEPEVEIPNSNKSYKEVRLSDFLRNPPPEEIDEDSVKVADMMSQLTHLFLPGNHRILSLLDKTKQGGLFLEENGIIEYARLFREIHARLFPPIRNAEEIGNITYLDNPGGPKL